MEELKLQEYCKQVKHQCIVQVNGKTIPLSSHTLFEVQHADYIRIDLPPHPKRTLHSRAIARCLRDGIGISDGPSI
jgi:predicted RNA binding protein YcfA (HicA-like mRNA interferase family)